MVQSGDDYQSGPKQVQTLVLPSNFEISPEMQAAINAARSGSIHDLKELEDQIDELVFQIMEIPLETRDRLKKAK